MSVSFDTDWVQGWSGKVNICELLINAVNNEKPKKLSGFNQKVRSRIPSCTVKEHGRNATGEEAIPNPLDVTYAEHGKPVPLPIGKVFRKEHL